MPSSPSKSPQDLKELEQQGNKYGDAGRFQEAIECYAKVISLDPKYARGYCNLGWALAEVGLVDDAIKNFKKALELAPNHARSYSNLGQALTHKGEHKEAIATHLKGIAIHPNPVAYNSLGWSYTKNGQYDEALECYRKAIKQDPDFWRPYLNIEACLPHCKNHQELRLIADDLRGTLKTHHDERAQTTLTKVEQKLSSLGK
jgi:tetratricopeptide (TPR) repeat protein